MNHPQTRRTFIRASTGLVASGLLVGLASAQETKAPPAGVPKAPPKPPALPPDQVRDTVGFAHRSLEKVRELVEATPLLANAVWDWGGGDFETPLEAAAHTGGREIAEYLLSKGARPSLYAAGMLGQLGLVQAFHAVNSKAHEIPGPHGFTLLHCARQGGDAAKPVLEWLLAQGVPDVKQRPLPFIWPEGTKPPGA
ncbi:MAG TPA: hypothetical protein VG734_12440 [Lacunisphaera sp.]|nr:hypothetical protein [Lacunisphaera sp.]